MAWLRRRRTLSNLNSHTHSNPKVFDILFVGIQKVGWNKDFGDDTDGELCTNTDELRKWVFFDDKVYL